MQLEIGYGDETYGMVSVSSTGLAYAGSQPETVRRLIESMRGPHQNNEELLASLPHRLRSRVWARWKQVQQQQEEPDEDEDEPETKPE